MAIIEKIDKKILIFSQEANKTLKRFKHGKLPIEWVDHQATYDIIKCGIFTYKFLYSDDKQDTKQSFAPRNYMYRYFNYTDEIMNYYKSIDPNTIYFKDTISKTYKDSLQEPNQDKYSMWNDDAREFYDSRNRLSFLGIPTSAEKYNGKNIDHVYSIDIHSAFPAALARIEKPLYPIINYYFLQRHNNPEYKEMLVKGIGCMARNEYCKLRYRVLKNHAIYFNKLVSTFKAKGCTILNLRTDAIIFRYEGNSKDLEQIEGFGNDLGQWNWKFKDVTYRQFSTSKYQYMEEGVHNIVLSGRTKLDEVKPDRSTWEWDDLTLTTCEPVKVRFNNKEQLYEYSYGGITTYVYK